MWLEDPRTASRHNPKYYSQLIVGIWHWQVRAVFSNFCVSVRGRLLPFRSGRIKSRSSLRATVHWIFVFLHPLSDVLYSRNCIFFEGRAMSLFVPLSGRTFARAAVTAASINVVSSSVSSLGADVTIYPESKRYFSRRRAKEKMASTFSLFWCLFVSSGFMIFYRERRSSTRCDG